jgi:purine-binding chemotaxis protein CheW
MSGGRTGGHVLADEMRRAFDEAFARPPRARAAPSEGLLAIVVAGDRYVLRLAEIAGLHADRPITTFPSAVPEVSGLVGLRSALVPVYDLAALLGYAKAAAPRWLVVLAAAPVALAFDAFEGYVTDVDKAAVVEAAADDDRPVREIVKAGALARPVLALAPLLDRIRQRAARAHPDKER